MECALEFSKLCRRIHRQHHQGNFLGALETLEQVGPDHIVGSQALDRESALSLDSIKELLVTCTGAQYSRDRTKEQIPQTA